MPPPGWTEISATTSWWRIDLRELWSARDVARSLAGRELRARYKQTVLGVAWVVLQPLTGTAVFSLIFGGLVDVSSDGIPYPAFVFCGLLTFSYFSSGVDAAANSLTDNRDLVTKIYFPRLLAPFAAVLPRLVDYGIGLVVLAIVMVVAGVTPGLALLLLPVWTAVLIVLTFGIGAGLGALNVRYRDVGHALATLLQLWLFASPVVFASSIVDGAGRYVLALNPMTGVLDGMRWSLLDGPAPPVADLVSLMTGVLLVTCGVLYFRRVERTFADVI